jgi:hypothetical protein
MALVTVALAESELLNMILAKAPDLWETVSVKPLV